MKNLSVKILRIVCLIGFVLLFCKTEAQPWTGGGITLFNPNGCSVRLDVLYYDVNIGAMVTAPGSPFYLVTNQSQPVNFPSTALWNNAFVGAVEIGSDPCLPNYADLSGTVVGVNCPASIPCSTGGGNCAALPPTPPPGCLLTNECCGCSDSAIWFDASANLFIYD